VAETPSSSQIASRIMFTLVGAGAFVYGAFLTWVREIEGVRLDITALYQRPFEARAGFMPTVGFLMIALGLLAVVGLATSGWLTRLAGALGIAVFILLLIQLYGAGGGASLLPGPGPWLALAGGVVAVVGGG
jgi:hypothetical protein